MDQQTGRVSRPRSRTAFLRFLLQLALIILLLLTPMLSALADEDWRPRRRPYPEQEQPRPELAGDAAAQLSADIVISQVYGGGGNAGAPYQRDFIELFNRGPNAVSINGWSLQYASAAGTNWTNKTNLSGTIPSGGYFLVVEASGGSNGSPLPVTGDITGTINLSATTGKLALVRHQVTITSGTSCPITSNPVEVVDFVGFGATANCYEGSGQTPAPSNSTAIFRGNNGCTETDNNNFDFATAFPSPRNSSSAPHYCGGPTNPSGIGAANPGAVLPGGTSLLTVAVTPGANPPSTGLAVSCDLGAIGGANPQTFYDDGTHGDTAAGDNTFSYQATLPVTLTAGSRSLPCTITDAQARTFSTTITIDVMPPCTPIHDVQGAGHLSPYDGQKVTLCNVIVTAIRRPASGGGSNAFWVEEKTANWDTDDATSEGLYIFLGSTAPTVAVGDDVTVYGTISEYRPASAPESLTLTELTYPLLIQINSSGNALPSIPIIGHPSGRVPPATVIEDDASGDVETSGIFDPVTDGIDFWESLEGMLVQCDSPAAVGPTHDFGSNREIPVVHSSATVRTPRGGIVVRPGDFNPERIILNDWVKDGPTMPAVDVGDTVSGTLTGVIDYSFNNYKLQVASPAPLTFVPGGITQETTAPAGPGEVAVATFNVENLAATDPITKFNTLANLIVNNLQAPDIIAIEEIQDNNGTVNDSVVDASNTWNTLINAITTAGGPSYSYRQIDPVDDQDGGAPGGNIRQGFLFRTDRGVAFVDRPGGGSTTANQVVGSGAGTQLLYSPGRIDPTNAAFTTSRKPLAGEFTHNGRTLFVIANHFNSKGGDDPLYGRYQPPVLYSEVQRLLQASAVNGFVDNLLAANPAANIVVLGDLNDFPWSNPLHALTGYPGTLVLHNLMEDLPENERYSYVYEGNSQALDQILLSDALYSRGWYAYDVVHVNSEFATQASDHDPQVVRLMQGLEIDKWHSPEPVTAGWNFTFYIDITNTAAAPATNVVVTDTLPTGVAPYAVQPSPGGVFDGVSTVVWTIPSIGPNSTMRLYIKARTFSTQAGNCLTNLVVADSDLATPLASATDVFCVVKGALAQPTPTPTPTPPPVPPGTTITLKKGGPGTSLDTYIYRNQPNSNYWLDPLLKVGYKQTHAALIQFDLSPIPPGATVEEAWLEVFAAGWSGPGSDISIGAYAISGTVQISQTTWVSPELGSTWFVPGGNDVLFDRRPLPESTVTTSGPLLWYRFNLKQLTQQWLDGTIANNGAMLRCELCTGGQMTLPGNLCPYTFFFASSEYSNPALWPKLVVRYQ
ncbi:MAG: Endonuclease/Exonuclease/phosphatase family protein [Chloroflexi bacterium ADurb.Bin180]|nr:MAG: Endonuclease/Exonuclease/phosphatase family protein [Chloroflexi bacterium ADurb.Bin180]